MQSKNFSNTGNFGFGINEHIDLGIKYDPGTGIYGMDFYIVLKRAANRVSIKKRCKGKIGKIQAVTKLDAIRWFQEKYDGMVL